MNYKPYGYQQYAEQFIIDHEEAGLFLDMGLGKTVVTLSAINRLLYEEFAVQKVLVIAPLTVAKSTWPTELKKWEHLELLTYSLVLGSNSDRVAALNTEADIYIINRENVLWLTQELHREKKPWPFDMVVVDELSSFKSASSNRFKALRQVRKYIKRFVGLTGTPAPNGLMDLFPQLYLLDQGVRLGRTITGFRQQYFVPGRRVTQTVFLWEPRPGAQEEIFEKIGDICISMKTEDYIDLPDRLNIRHEIEFSQSEMQQYEELKKEAVLELTDGAVTTANAAVLAGKLLQLTGGAMYDNDKNVIELNDAKLKALEELIESANGQPVLIFYTYKHEYDRIIQKWPHFRSVKEPGAIDDWNAGKIAGLLAQPASAGHGLNLQYGGHIAIWYSLPWSLELYQQANKRLHRNGATETVLVHHILVKNTIDYRILDLVLKDKEARQDALLEAVKAEVMKGRS